MAVLSHFPPHLLSFSSHNSQTFFCSHRSSFHSNRHYCYRQHSIVCLASPTQKTRPSRKLMSDVELCDILREFVASVGLPEGHVPSTKELSQHGRKDLANIVRRRGHKIMKELLISSAKTATDGFDSLGNLNGHLNDNCYQEETGQGEKPEDMIKQQGDILLMDADFASGTNLLVQHESAFMSNGEIHVSKEPSVSLEEKVEKFMKYGQLDAVEDDNLNDGGRILNHGQSLAEGELVIHSEVDVRHLTCVSNNDVGQNGSLLLKRDTHLSAQGLQNTDFDNNMHAEIGKMENEVEINRLKQMLHQKEVELSRLKEEIEREKHSLSILQTRAEDEISKAQKLISEKDAELLAAEESLSGLAEAKIEYSGEGQMVEVAGSFNGWHQRIKLDPQLSSSIVDPVGSRKSRLWSTKLWLYPGVYEIKFIVDGHWKVDPQRESTVKGGLENNIFRVNR